MLDINLIVGFGMTILTAFFLIYFFYQFLPKAKN